MQHPNFTCDMKMQCIYNRLAISYKLWSEKVLVIYLLWNTDLDQDHVFVFTYVPKLHLQQVSKSWAMLVYHV